VRALALLALLGGCAVPDPVAVRPCPGADCDAGDRDLYCAGTGPPVLVGDGAGAVDICSGALAEQTFAHALCTCRDYESSHDLEVDAFDSREGPYEGGAAGGAVGINGKLDGNGSADVGGALRVAGAQGVRAGAVLRVGGELHSGGPLDSELSAVTVAGDARVAGDVRVAALEVAGTLTVPDDAVIDVSGPSEVGAVARAPVAVPEPCACGPDDLLDVAGYVEAHRFANHNADIGLDAGALNGFDDDLTLELPCGLFFLDRIQGEGALTIEVSGRTALFVAQGITLQEELRVELVDGAELDLFAASHVNTSGPVNLGSSRTPARVRLYVGGAGAINLSAAGTFGGNLYAPLMDLALSGGAEVFGSMFVSSVRTSGPLTIHYDVGVESAGEHCID
jgi:hypothetical protein